ncbi:MAG TPA: hypothetical protein VGE45_21480 [Chloroflexia bacterium]|jgi:prenyltransferase beta subunit
MTTAQHHESELLMKIKEELPEEVYKRYDKLAIKCRKGTLTLEEHKELISITDNMENLSAQRIRYLIELAQLRNTTLTELMETLGIKPRTPGKTLKRKRS